MTFSKRRGGGKESKSKPFEGGQGGSSTIQSRAAFFPQGLAYLSFKMMAMDPAVQRCRLLVYIFLSFNFPKENGVLVLKKDVKFVFFGKMNSNGIRSHA